MELVETVREATEPECDITGTQTTEGTGKLIKSLLPTSGVRQMNTLTTHQEADQQSICTS